MTMNRKPVFFLDSNVFLGFGDPLNSYYDQCRKLLKNSGFDKFKCDLVLREVKRVLRKREKYYLDFAKTKEPDFDVMKFCKKWKMNKNDKSAFITFIRQKEREGEDFPEIFRQYRLLYRHLKVEVDKAFKIVNKQTIPRQQNFQLEDALFFNIPNKDDAWILSDYFTWATKKEILGYFVTMDRHFFERKQQILASLKTFFLLELLKFDIRHVKDMIQMED